MAGRSFNDDASESAFFSTRGTLAMAVSEAAKYLAERGAAEKGAPAILRLITQLAARFEVNVSEKVALFAFEQEFSSKQDCRVTAMTFTHMMLNIKGYLSAVVVEEFKKNSISYSRV